LGHVLGEGSIAQHMASHAVDPRLESQDNFRERRAVSRFGRVKERAIPRLPA
jgi:hypothetical protein